MRHSISWLLILLALCAVSGCSGGRDERSRPASPLAEPAKPPVPPGAVKGFGLSPQGFPADYSKLAAFAEEVGGMPNGGAMFNGAWLDDVTTGSTAGEPPTGAEVVSQLARQYGFTPVIVFGWRSGSAMHLKVPGGSANNWTDKAARDLFRQMVATFVTKNQPRFLFLGNENDFYFEQDPEDYARWIAFYNETYGLIKAKSPNTLVGPVLNFEHLSGSGRLNGWTASHWGALDAHDMGRVDIIGLTVYPWLQYKTATEVPGDYLAPLIARIGTKPVAITETGWPAERLGGLDAPWVASESEQVAFVGRLADLVRGNDVRIVNWLFLHAMGDSGGTSLEWKLYGSISLRDAAGKQRPAYEAWLKWNP